MKFATYKYFLSIFLLCCCSIITQAQTMAKGYKVNMEITIDEKGDAAVTITAKYNAQLWDLIKQNHGADPSVQKNIWKKQFPKYQLTEFSFPNNDIDQTIVSKFKILGMLKVDAAGKWVAELDSKDPNITKLSESSFMLIDEATSLNMKINLPSSASDAKVEKDSFGKAQLTYNAPVSGGGAGNIIKYLGFLVAAGGIFLFFKAGGLKTIAVSDPKNKKIEYHQAKKIDDAIVINTPAKEPLKSSNDISSSTE